MFPTCREQLRNKWHTRLWGQGADDPHSLQESESAPAKPQNFGLPSVPHRPPKSLTLKTFFLGYFNPCAPSEWWCMIPWWPLHTATPASLEDLLMGQRTPTPRNISTRFTFKMAGLTHRAPPQTKATLVILLRSTMVKNNSVNRNGHCSSAPPGLPSPDHPECAFSLTSAITRIQRCAV